MIVPLTTLEDLHAQMVEANKRTLRGPWTERYRATAEWWRLAAKESATPEAFVEYAVGLERLAADIEAAPRYYVDKPNGKTNWEWFQKGRAA